MTEYKAFDHPQLKTGDGRILSSLLMAEAQGLIKMTGVDMKIARSQVYSSYASKMEPPLTEGLLLSWIMRDIMAEKKLNGNMHREKHEPMKPGPKPGSHRAPKVTELHGDSHTVARSKIVTGDEDPFVADHENMLSDFVYSELSRVSANQTIAIYLESERDKILVKQMLPGIVTKLNWRYNVGLANNYWLGEKGNTVYIHRFA